MKICKTNKSEFGRIDSRSRLVKHYLREKESPIEGEFCDIIPPNVTVDRVMRIVCPTIANVPEPFLAPKTYIEIQKKIGGERKTLNTEKELT